MVPRTKTLTRLINCYMNHKLCKLVANRRRASTLLQTIPANDFISTEITVAGWYEHDLLEDVTYLLKTHHYLEGTFVDVGANIGNHSAWFSQFFDKIVAFEPSPITFPYLKTNAEKISKIQPFNFGLSNTNQTSTLMTCSTNLGKAGQAIDLSNPIISEIELRVGDDISALRDPSIRAIKIDVEGAKLFVLEGIRTLLATNQPILILESSFPPKVVDLLLKLNYRFFYQPNSPFRRERGIVKQIIRDIGQNRPIWKRFDPSRPGTFEEMAVASVRELTNLD